MTLHRNLINGEWVSALNVTANVNPSDLSDIVGQYAQGDAHDVDAAVTAAAAAFPAWSTSGIQTRHDALERIGCELLARTEELGNLLAREEGKTLAEAIGEVVRAGQVFKFFAGECLRLAGETLASIRPGVGVEVSREPLGVVALITPWNFPIAIPAWKIAPALAFGNCVVFKPADLVPGSAWALTEVIHRSGLPPGVFNLVMGSGRLIGEALVTHREVAAVSFTGSVPVGRSIGETCVKTGKKVQLEMGGKNPQVVLDDADLAKAVELTAQSCFYSTGQRCTASSRVIVTDRIYPAFLQALMARISRIRVGDARHAQTDMGPVVSQSQLEHDLSHIEIAKREGAVLAVGGVRTNCHSGSDRKGFFLQPALFVDSTPDMRINREEVFGPVASMIRVRDYEEALAVANDTEFGLSAGIATTSLKYATHFKRHAQAGMVMVNLPTAGVDYHAPFGGRKSSSYGPREQGRYAQEFYTTVKTSYTLA
jgi:acyl-CoA reductase-like NAD-dependent aldehyde dehydrogenase